MNQIQIPPLAEGETYIGAIGNAAGELYHVVLLPDDNDRSGFEAQLEWAKSVGGDLPNRLEQAMLFAHHRDLFQKAAYWSNQRDEDDDGWAWCQLFHYGYQDLNRTDYALRARAVRRLPI
ncbi:DUF1566 domain-containing protein [Herbaspirillum sp. RV1423]|uniref:DUF1566 domain-containing protein n=1 Tax=Herbaspirillum sp. RV1423 TaxID=1443993 RepID=UPI0004B06B55|nr:DUF1566 domain-containing protein [Herbaspirillum sp. RV1423]